MDGVQLPQGYRHFKEAVYFLPFSSQTFLVLIFSFINLRRKKGWVNLGATLWFLNARPLDWESSALTTIRPLLIGLFQKKQGAWGHTFFKKNPGIFHFCTSPWRFQTKYSSTPGNSTKLHLIPWKFQAQKWIPLEIPHYFFLVTLGNSPSFLTQSCKFHMLFLWYPSKFHILTPSPCPFLFGFLE